jgi:hypothetical protein
MKEYPLMGLVQGFGFKFVVLAILSEDGSWDVNDS